MLAHVLALAVGLGSFALYMAAFFFPEVHRKHDFFWSGLGLFYALVLWSCDRQLTGAVLLGQSASVALLLWLGGQTLSLRRLKTPQALQTPATAAAWQGLQAELTLIGRNAIARTPLGRLLGWQPMAIASPVGQSKLRASSIRDVGYEFLNDLDGDLEHELTPAQGPKASPAADQTPAKRRPLTRAAVAKTAPGKPLGQLASKPASKPVPIVAQARSWLGSLVSSFNQPKPSRPMIEIPPRESSLGRNRPAPETTPETAPETAPETTLETAPETAPEPEPETVSEPALETVSEPASIASDIDIASLDWGESNWPEAPPPPAAAPAEGSAPPAPEPEAPPGSAESSPSS